MGFVNKTKQKRLHQTDGDVFVFFLLKNYLLYFSNQGFKDSPQME